MTVEITAECAIAAEDRYDHSTHWATLAYKAVDPLAVYMTVDGIEWVFARTLLRENGDGEGDVQVVHRDSLVEIYLSSPNGQACVLLESAVVDEFLDRSRLVCPFGSETYNVDSWIERCRLG